MFKPLFLLTTMMLLCTQCSVAPFLESPRITSGIKVEAAITTSEQSLQWELSDTITRGGVNSRSISHDFSGETVNGLPRFSLGIQDKVELGGYLIGSFSYVAWEGRIKYGMLDYGSPVLFKNIGAAALCGTKGFNAEWDHARRSWGGLTIGTLHRHSKLELEYIVMPSLGYNSLSSNDDGIGSGSIFFYDLSLTTGLSCNIARRLYTSAAITYAHDFNPHQKISSESLIKAVSFDANPYSFQATLGYRFGRTYSSSQ